MKKRFFVNLILLLTLNILIKPFWVLGIDRTVQNVVGAADYGLYFSLFNFSILLNIILDFGLTNYNNRNIAQHKQLLSKYLSNIIVLKFVLALFYAVLAITIGFLIGYSWEQFRILLLLVFNQFLLSFILYLRSNISGLHLFKTDSLISVLDRFFMILICSVLLWSNFVDSDFKIEWFVYAQTFSYLFTALIAFFVVLSKAKYIKLKFDKKLLIVILKQTFPFALLVFFMSFYNRFDSVIIERLLENGKEQVGVYAQAFRLLDASTQFALLFAALLLPIFAKMLKKKEPINELVRFSYLLLLTPGIILVVVSVFYRVEIMDLLYKEHVENSSLIFAILISTFLPIATTYIFGTLLTANGNLKKLNIMAGIGVVINLSLNLILIPRLEAKGAAIASIITQVFTAIAQLFIAKQIFKFQLKLKPILTILSFIISLVIIVYVIHLKLDNFFLGISSSIIIGIILGFVFKLINLKTIYKILRYDDA